MPGPLRYLRNMLQRSYGPLLKKAHDLAMEFLDTLSESPVGRPVDFAALVERAGGPLPTTGEDPIHVIEHLARAIEPGLVRGAADLLYQAVLLIGGGRGLRASRWPKRYAIQLCPT